MSTPITAPQPTPALRLLPTPAWEPPYSETGDAPALARREQHSAAARQQALPLAFVLPGGVPAVPEPRLRLVDTARTHSGRPADADEMFDPQPTPRVRLPDPRFWGGKLVQAMLEVDAGVRPVAQLRRWTSDAVYARLARRSHHRRYLRARSADPLAQRVWVRSVRACEPADGVAEVSAVVHQGGRVRALAVRLEGTDGRWRCTVLEP